jgi:hypothetical protein
MKSRIIIIALLCISALGAAAQQTVIMHYMQSVPQRSMNNPAFVPDSRFHFGIPGLSSLTLGYRNSIALKDVFIRTADDSLLIDLPTITEKLGPGNLIGLDMNEELLSAGLRLGKNYISISSSLNMPFRMNLPPDLLKFVVEGNSAFLGETAEIGGLGLNFNLYLENSLGISRQITEALRVGARGKLLLGLAHLSTQDLSIGIYTDPDDYSLTASSRILVNAALPFVADSINLGSLDSFSFTPPDFSREYVINTLKAGINKGYAFDFGINYKLSDKWSFNLSVLDIGSITWDKNVRQISSDQASFTFEGLDIFEMFTDSTSTGDKAEQLLDSLTSIFQFQVGESSFRQTLTPKIYAGASFSLTKGTIFGAVVYGEYFNKRFYPTYTFSLTKRMTRVLTLAGSYTIRQGSYANFGAGFSLNLLGVQFYMLTDNASNFAYWDQSLNFNLRFGLNVTVGRKMKSNNPMLDT